MMKLLFLTTFNVLIEKEHFFTINVWKHLSSCIENCCLATIILDPRINDVQISENSNNKKKYYILRIPEKSYFKETILISHIEHFFSYISPDIIHSNMIEGYDVIAAKHCKIPIVLTIHIGGILCPRGGGNGFLTYKDSICNQPISPECFKCCSLDIPIPILARTIAKIIPHKILLKLYDKFKGEKIYYISAILHYIHNIEYRKRLIATFKYATIIAADKTLVRLLNINGLSSNIVLIPHGIPALNKMPVKIQSDEPIKFFTLGRIQYAKGLHILLQALKGIDKNKYELHILGDFDKGKNSRFYNKKLLKQANGLNITFHGMISHDNIYNVIKDYHVMIHSTICLEVYGIAIAESLSIGKPVIATRCGGAEMQIINGKNGWLVEPNDAKDLRKQILQLIAQPQLIETASAKCHTPHPISEYIEKLNKLYKTKTNT